MEIQTILEIASTVMLSLGGGAAIIFVFSNYLGNIWANRLMAQETSKHNHALEELRAKLQLQTSHHTHIQKQKIDLYLEVSNPVIDLIVKAMHSNGKISAEELQNFDKIRLTNTALLAMFAPKVVFDEYNDLLDYLFNAMEGKEQWGFPEFRVRALKFLSLIRADIGLYNDSISYNGLR